MRIFENHGYFRIKASKRTLLEENKQIFNKSNIYSFLTQKIVYHSLFWIALLVLFVYLSIGEESLTETMINEFINLTFYAVLVYVNTLYLIPYFLKQKKIFTYLVLLLAVALFITPIKIFVFHFRLSGNDLLQSGLIENQHYFYLANLFVAFGSTLVNIIFDWMQHQRERTILENQNIQSELRFLKSQINPHFLFNTLNSIYALTLKKSDDAPEIVVKLSEMLRYMLYECNEKLVPLSKEVNYIRNYLALEQLRHGGKISINFDVEGDVEGQSIAPLLFVPFLENSFKHGASKTIKDGYVNVHLQMLEKHKIQFVVKNNKTDTFPTADHSLKSGGIGLANLDRRLNILYPKKHNLTIKDSPNEYEVILDLSL